jgi:tripartite-type tricarboxylate transporter receptor subunit TctC
MRSRLAAIGFEPMGGTPQQFAAYLRQEIGKWNKVIKATGARLE